MKKNILLFIPLFSLLSCNDEVEIMIKDFPFILLNEISSVSNDGVVVSASFYNENEVPYSEYGLVIDLNNTPSVSNRKIALNNNPDKDFQVSINNDLIEGETYYIRAFIRTSDNLIYSNTLSFESKGCRPPTISSVSANSATSGSRIIIEGNNFSEAESHNEVLFNDLKSTVIKASSDTLIVFCPNTSMDQSVKIKVTVATKTTEARQEFKLLNPWKQIGNFPANPTILNGYFTHNSKGYLIPGSVISGPEEEQQKFWEFDVNAYEWNTISNIPFETDLWTVGFAKGNDLFCGLGYNQRDLWQYNPDSKIWTQKSSYPGLLRNSFTYRYFQIDNTVYFYQDGSSEFWKYSIESDEWIQLPTQTELYDRKFICGYSYNNTGYLLEMEGGYDNHSFNIWKFDKATNSFTIEHSVTVNSRIEPGSFIIKDNLYIPTRMGSLIQYSLADRKLFYLDDPSDIYEYSFVFQGNNKAVVGLAHTRNVYEFYPRQ